MTSRIRACLGLNESAADAPDALRDVVDALDRMEPERARYLAQFAYLLGRVAHADQHVSSGETAAMEQLVASEGGLPADQAVLVVALAKTSARLFGGTDNFLVARDFAAASTPEQRLALMRCLFVLSSVDDGISVNEEREIQQVGRELRVEPADLMRLRLEYRHHLPGLSRPQEP